MTGQRFQQLRHQDILLGVMTQWKLGIHVVRVPTASLPAGYVSLKLQVRDDLVSCTLSYAYGIGDFTSGAGGVMGYVTQYQPVVGNEGPPWRRCHCTWAPKIEFGECYHTYMAFSTKKKVQQKATDDSGVMGAGHPYRAYAFRMQPYNTIEADAQTKGAERASQRRRSNDDLISTYNLTLTLVALISRLGLRKSN